MFSETFNNNLERDSVCVSSLCNYNCNKGVNYRTINESININIKHFKCNKILLDINLMNYALLKNKTKNFLDFQTLLF